MTSTLTPSLVTINSEVFALQVYV